MPIEIKELHIRVTVNSPQSGRQSDERTVAAGSGDINADEAKEAIVAECVEQVLSILQNKTER